MLNKIYVLDTNVLITNPSSFLAYGKNDTVVIPYKVIEELERHKLDSGDVGFAVKSCSRLLMAVIGDTKQETLKTGIELQNKSTLKVIAARDLKHVETVGALKSGDDHILAVCVGLDKTHPEIAVTLVSNDMLLKIRANSFNIPSESHLGSANVKSLEDLYSGNQETFVGDEMISTYWEEEADSTKNFSVSEKELNLAEKLSPNEFVVLRQHGVKVKRPWSVVRRTGSGVKKHLRFVPEHQLDKLEPLNIEQHMAIDLLMDPKVHLVSLMGQAGTGKTILSIEAGLRQVMRDKRYKVLLILRPVHSVGKDIGYLPGTKEEKLEPWLAPIKDNLRFLLGDENRGNKKDRRGGDKLDYLFDQGIIEMEAMSFIRGRSIPNAFILVDEAQNINQHELKTILTRVGKGTKVVLTGDIEQTDRNDVGTLTNGLAVSIEKFRKYGIAGHVTLKEGVRSELSALAARIL